MKIQVLMENNSLFPELTAEHGLSLYIETKKHRILFDSGQSDAFINNAEKMGIDLRTIDTVVLSHGHYDHGGGLKAFLKINQNAKIYMNENAFGAYFHGEERYIGLDLSLKESPQIQYVGDQLTIDDELSLFSCNDRKCLIPVQSYGLTVHIGHSYIPDQFRHEQYLMIQENGKKVLISGCSHKGILNIMNWFEADILVGGFHFMKLDPEREEDCKILSNAAEELMKYPTKYYTGHCTGLAQYDFLKKIMGNQLDDIHVGKVIEI